MIICGMTDYAIFLHFEGIEMISEQDFQPPLFDRNFISFTLFFLF